MPAETEPLLPQTLSSERCLQITRICCGLVMAIGISVLIGWLLNSFALKSILPGAVAMKSNTAIALCLAALSLFLFSHFRPGWTKVSIGLAAALIALSALTLAQYMTGVNLGIDEFLFRDLTRGVSTRYPAGRMAPITAFNFLCLGAALLLLHWRKHILVAQGLVACAACTALLATIGYLFDVTDLYRSGHMSAIAVNTAFAFLTLCTGFWCATSNCGFMRVLTGSGGSSLLLRWVGLTAIVVPLTISWLHLQADQLGWFEPSLGAALFALVHVFTFLLLAWFSASSLRRAEQKEAGTQERLRRAHAELEDRVQERTQELEAALYAKREIMRNSLDVICIIDAEGHFTKVSDACEKLWGYSPAELIGQPFIDLVHPDDRARSLAAASRIVEGDDLRDFENRYVRKDGSVVTMMWSVSWSATAKSMFCVARDMTARKAAEGALRHSDERFRLLAKAANDAIWDLDLGTNILWWNEGFEQFFGYQRAEMDPTLQSWTDSLHPDDLARVSESLDHALENGSESWVDEYRFRRKDGSYAYVRDRGHIIRDEAGKAIRMIGGMQDITEHKQAETALRASEAEFRMLAEAMPQILWVTRPDGWHTHFNQRWMDYTGLSLQESLGHGWLPPFHPEDQPIAAERWKHANATGDRYEIEYRLRGADGNYRWMLGRALPLRDAAGAIVKWFGTCTDIHDLKLAEQEVADANLALVERSTELTAAKETADRANRAKSEFLANMSHEIRTPMNGILGMTDLTLETELNDEQRDYLGMVKNSAHSLLGVINDILDFSKIEAGKLEMEEISFSLRETIGAILKPLGLRADQKQLELVADIPAHVPDHLIGDPMRLRQILLNFADNAIKFTERGEIVLTIAMVSAADDRAELQFSVSDTGIGIPAEKQASIFEAFAQVDGSTTRQYGGTGLGLAIATRLVRQMKGRIWLESSLGKGTTFHFTVALGTSAAPLAALKPIDPERLEGLRVLIVDDNALNRRIFQEMLSNWRMQPAAVSSAFAALEVMRDAAEAGDPFPLVLLDAVMPEMDGFALAQSIKTEPRLAGATVMMLSSAAHTGQTSRASALGIYSILSKPIIQSELLDTILLSLGENALAVKPAPRDAAARAPRVEDRLEILVVDDNAINRAVVTGIIAREGYHSTQAGNGREALEALARKQFDVVLMDVSMPEMDGFEATARIRQMEGETGRHLPIVAMTAHAMSGDRERCLAGGMDDYISKPLQKADVIALLKKVAEGRVAALSAPAAPSSPPANETIFSRAKLLEDFDGDEALLEELVRLFRENTPGALDELRESIAREHAGDVTRSAHSLLSSFGVFGATQAQALARQLENLGRGGDAIEARQTFRDLEDETARVGKALERLTAAAA